MFDVNGDPVGRWVLVDAEKELPPNASIRPLRVNVGDAIVRNPETGEVIELPYEVRGDKGEFKQARWIEEQGMTGIETLMIIDKQLDVKGEASGIRIQHLRSKRFARGRL